MKKVFLVSPHRSTSGKLALFLEENFPEPTIVEKTHSDSPPEHLSPFSNVIVLNNESRQTAGHTLTKFSLRYVVADPDVPKNVTVLATQALSNNNEIVPLRCASIRIPRGGVGPFANKMDHAKRFKNINKGGNCHEIGKDTFSLVPCWTCFSGM